MTTSGVDLTPAVIDLILHERGLAYAISDPTLRVVHLGGVGSLFAPDGQDCQGRSMYELMPELIGCEQQMVDILDGRMPRFDLKLLNRDGEAGKTLYLNLINLPHVNAQSQITGIIHILENSTTIGEIGQRLVQQRNELHLLRDQLMQQNEALASANAELTRLDEIKSMFVTIAAHELRSPLASISGYLEMLLAGVFGALPPAQEDALRVVGGEVQHLISITGNLLDATRLEAGRVELDMVPLRLPSLVETVAAQMMPRLETKEQRLEVTLAPDLPLVLCDRMRTMQIISNLLDNACKYTGRRGRITITLGLAAEPGFAQISIGDSGIGIAASDQVHLFKRFFRAESAALAGESGTGLGLHIARSLVELHGGRIWLQSTAGEGTTFFVTLPLADTDNGQ